MDSAGTVRTSAGKFSYDVPRPVRGHHGSAQHEMLRKTLDVTLENDPAYPLEPGRIEALNDYLHAAARSLLELPVVDESKLSDQLDALQPSIEHAPVILNERLLR